jgi:hypothetical protein
MLKLILAAVFLTACTANSQNTAVTAAEKQTTAAAGKGIAVLELFTSEGCSSCPPADKLAASLQQEYKENLVVLEFHVDYWNRLGWKDPFSKAAFSQRQRDYAERFKLESVYTPQAVINGIAEAVGSSENKLKQFIEKAISAGDTDNLSVTASAANNNSIVVNWKYAAPENTVINFALVQKHATVNIKAGENNGRKLEHYNIVNDFVTVDAVSSGSIQLTTPQIFLKDEYTIVVYAQDKESGKIITATSIEKW